MPTEGWAIELKGDHIDVDDAREALQPPFDPWVEGYEDDTGNKFTLIRTRAWATLSDAADVTRDAKRVIERLNGAGRLIHEDARPLTVGAVFKFDAAGKRIPILVAGTGSSQSRSRVRGRRCVGKPPPPAESNIQRWFREADADDDRAELFSHVARADNWYDVYKSSELVRKLAGGKHALLSALGTKDATFWNLMFRTANCYRHAPDPINYPRPTPPADLQEARKFLFKLASKFL